ncbi:MAG TPA: STAS domain-containing protein [Armatimonadota bacterium]
MDLEITPEAVENTLVLHLEGELDTYNCGQLRSALVEQVEAGHNHVVVDMSAVEYIDSTGLGSLVGGLKRVSEHGGEMKIVCNNPQIVKVFEITGLDKVFAIHRTLDSALGK